MKKSKKHDGAHTFYEALVNTYGTSVEEQEIKIGSKIVESYGFEKLQRLQADFTYLKNISLSRKQIVEIRKDEEELIQEHLKNLRELDLSFNLISSWKEILTIIRNLKLKKLKLVGNRITRDFEVDEEVGLQVLNLSFTAASESLFKVIPKNFPRLEKLHLADNHICTLNESITTMEKLTELDLSMNKLASIPDIIRNSNITTLNISDNQIQLKNTELVLPKIKVLDIRRNKITKWEELNILTNIFPNVKELRINGNPVFDELSYDEAEMNVIARFEKITSLNGTSISEEERTNAELYFISKVNGSGYNSADRSRLEALAEKHRIKLTNRHLIHEDNILSRLVRLKINYHDQIREIDTLKTIEILKLKGIISRLFNISYVDMELSYVILGNKEPISNDLSLVSSYEFEPNQNIYVQKIT